jgi:quinol monooxygenase YgiN
VYARVIHFRLKPGQEQALHDLQAGLVAETARGLPGFVRKFTFMSSDDPLEGMLLQVWESREQYQSFLAQPAHDEIVRRLSSLTDGEAIRKNFTVIETTEAR